MILGTVKKLGGSFKIVHDKFRSKSTEEASHQYARQLSDILQMHPDLKPQVQKPVVSFRTYLPFALKFPVMSDFVVEICVFNLSNNV